jgi:hypothetical protein
MPISRIARSKIDYKVTPQNCSRNLLSKVGSKATPRLVSPMESCSSKLLLPEAASWSGKLSKVAPQCSYPMLFPGAAPKAVLQSGFRTLRFKVATRSCYPKLLPQSCNLSNLYTKTAPQSYSA